MPMLKSSVIADASALAATTRYKFQADSWRVLSVHAMWTAGTVSATVKLQYSNDPRVVTDPNNAVWEDYTTSTAITTNGSKIWGDVGSTFDALYWSVLYTHASGSSTTFKAFVANVNRT